MLRYRPLVRCFSRLYHSAPLVRMTPVTPSIAVPSDIPSMHQFMLDEFLPSMSLTTALGLTRDEAYDNFLKMTTTCVNTGTSVVLRNESGRLVGLRICSFEDRAHPHEIEGFEQLSDKMKTFYGLIDVLHEDKWDSIPSHIDKLWNIEVMVVDEEYRGMGLARVLMEFGVDEAIKKGVKGAVAELVADSSIADSEQLLFRIFAKYGYSVLKEVVHSEYLRDNGLPVFVCPEGPKVAQLAFKEFVHYPARI